jgi:trans-aconitate 2-methyltransferase
MPWDPERYHQFQRERAAPFEDLFRCIRVREGLSVIDLGCGTGGGSSREGAPRPGSEVVGIDTSPQMLARAEEYARPGLRFEPGAIETASGEWDLVFSHAAIQWVDDHPRLVPRLLSLVRPGGQLAVQLPSNHDHPSHRLIREISAEEPFRRALEGWMRPSPVLGIDAYAELLHASGGVDLTVFEKVYPHVLRDADAVADWTSGTALVPYFERLSEPMRDAFMRRYRERLRERWPDGPIFYGFRRTLFAATRAA